MLQQYLGEEPFRRGITDYLNRHAYANTETEDLWNALEAATGQPVRRIADSWILQPGHPVIGVDLSADGSTLRLTQSGFRYLGGYDEALWSVPLLLRWADAEGEHTSEVLLEGDSTEIGSPGRSNGSWSTEPAADSSECATASRSAGRSRPGQPRSSARSNAMGW